MRKVMRRKVSMCASGEPANLFAAGLEEDMSRNAPLASRMRPRTLDEVVGQEELLGPGAPLRTAIEAGAVGSMIFFGPPGSGKTTVARLVADAIGADFQELSAVDSGVGDVRTVLEAARRRREEVGARTVLFLDEIHRFTKAQQDAFLHAVEDGLIILIGATTENPFFTVISPLLSRCDLHRFQALNAGAVRTLVDRALSGGERGLARDIQVGEEERDLIAHFGGGDGRKSLSLLERAAALAERAGSEVLDGETLDRATGEKPLRYDRKGDLHYDYASAFIKSMRGSDPDAAVYYLAVMLAGGEDPLFIARRMVIFASEDVGNADPRGLEVAVAAARAVEFVGLPEARINLSHAVIYLACAPKSNASYRAIDRAWEEVEKNGPHPPPAELRDAHYRGAQELGHGVGYEYPHSHGGFGEKDYLPEELRGRVYYEPTDSGEEGGA